MGAYGGRVELLLERTILFNAFASFSRRGRLLMPLSFKARWNSSSPTSWKMALMSSNSKFLDTNFLAWAEVRAGFPNAFMRDVDCMNSSFCSNHSLICWLGHLIVKLERQLDRDGSVTTLSMATTSGKALCAPNLKQNITIIILCTQ